MSTFAVSKSFRVLFSSLYRQSAVGSRTNSPYLRGHFDSLFDGGIRKNYCEERQLITIHIEKPDGTFLKRQGRVGFELLRALSNDPEIPEYGICSGSKVCGTCCVIFTDADYSTVLEQNKLAEIEKDQLDLVDITTKYNFDEEVFLKNGRLGCCIRMSPEMDGMTIKVLELFKK